MRIWLIAKKGNFDDYQNRRFISVARREGINLKMVDPANIDLFVSGEASPRVFLNDKVTRLPDCVLPRTGSGSTHFVLAALRQLDELGVPVINKANGIERARDKLATTQTLALHNIPVPKTMLARFPVNLDLVNREFHYPVIVKTVSGSYGKGVFLCSNRQMLEDVMGLIEQSVGTSAEKTPNMIIQEFVSTSAGKDIRVIVVGGRPIGAMLRKAKAGNFKSNVALGASVSPYKLTPELEWLATVSSRLIGLEIAGVDILFDGDSYKVCEVNSAPQFHGFERATGINIAKEIFNYIRIRLTGTGGRA
jgi:RimK family alpha-L-glutamate ligase